MACPKCECNVHYEYDDHEAAFDLGSAVGYLQRCAACGELFDIEDAAEDDDDDC